ncbi:primase-helicase family protein [Bradyrhizobium sp. USDA 329]|uniref:primase-helicase family protein n=1 Tax=unclassified Bradyrhizobium TaxID=2631580 RepID=UPI003515253D
MTNGSTHSSLKMQSTDQSPDTEVQDDLPRVGTPEFEERCEQAMKKVCDKYAWTAQHGGIVLRRNPLKMAPLQDYVWMRIAKAEYGFRYYDSGGRKKVWFPSFETVLSQYYEPEYHDEPYNGVFVIAERVEFLPGEPEISHDRDGCRVLNLWTPPPWDGEGYTEEPTVFLEHLAYIFDNDSAAIEHVLNFLAHLVQRPQERVGHALLITSEAKGIGKSTLGTVVRRLVGEQNSRVAQTKDLKSSFDGWLIGKLVVQVDEVYEAGNWDLANKLKPLITEPTVSANIKYGPQLEIENYARFIMFSNHSAPLNIEEGDRRYFVFNSKAQPRQDDYYDRLYGYIETPEAMNALYGFLMKRDLSGFSPFRRPPMTEAKKQIIAESEHPLHTYIIDAVVSGHFRRELGAEFSFDALARQLAKDGYSAQAKNTKEVGSAMKLAGATQARKPVGDRKVRMYVLPAVEEDGDDEDHKF